MKKNKKVDAPSKTNGNTLLCDVPLLMKRWFDNRDEKRKIKIERGMWMEKYNCEFRDEMEKTDCIHREDFKSDINQFCDSCKTRHNFYLRLKKLSNENIGILNKVRWAVRGHSA